LWSVETEASEIFAVAFSPDGRSILSGSADSTVKLWVTSPGVRVVQIFKGTRLAC